MPAETLNGLLECLKLLQEVQATTAEVTRLLSGSPIVKQLEENEEYVEREDEFDILPETDKVES